MNRSEKILSALGISVTGQKKDEIGRKSLQNSIPATSDTYTNENEENALSESIEETENAEDVHRPVSTSSSSDSHSGSSSSSESGSNSSSNSGSSSPSQVDDTDEDETYVYHSENESSETNLSEEEDNGKSRKRKAEEWKRNVAKKLRNSGKEYHSLKTGQLRPGRKLLIPCNQTCRLKCTSRISENDRKYYFDSFWKLGDIEKQRIFIINHMKVIQPQYRHVVLNRKRNRGLNKAYFFTKNDEIKFVCRRFFISTLGITDRYIRTAISKNEDGFLETDQRGKKGHSVVPEAVKRSMREHLATIPAVESHYTRANTQKKYIEGGKTVTDLYNDYVEGCKAAGQNYGKLSLYRHLFNYEFNMSFHIPKKDQCLQCNTYKNSDDVEKQDLEGAHNIHIEEKQLSREEKKNDKEKINDLFQVACFDLQAALLVPKGDVSSFYYKSRLNCYNFTICELKQKGLGTVECYFWHEGEGKRGASEIGTCMLKFLNKKSDLANSNDLEIVLYSDNCGGQGKNKYIITAYLHAVKHYKIKKITHKFLIVGHGQNEGDASHSTIEKAIKKAQKNGPIYVPSHYAALIGNARKKGNRFHVNEMAHADFFDLKDLAQKTSNSKFNVNSEGQKFNFNDIAIIKVERAHLDRYFYKTSYKDDEFQSVIIMCDKTRTKRNSLVNYSLIPAYQESLPITKKKFDDLQSLVRDKSIPAAHSFFYSSLRHE